MCYSPLLWVLEHIFALEATDDFLTERVQGLSQSEAEKMLYTQEEFVSRLQSYRQLSASHNSVLDYFDELELHPEYIGTFLESYSSSTFPMLG